MVHTSNKTKDVQCEYSHYDQDDLKENQDPKYQSIYEKKQSLIDLLTKLTKSYFVNLLSTLANVDHLERISKYRNSEYNLSCCGSARFGF